MGAGQASQETATERYALARRGLPLPAGSASVPRAPWLPAAVRGRALADPARAPATQQGVGIEDSDIDTGNGFAPSPGVEDGQREPRLAADDAMAPGPAPQAATPARPDDALVDAGAESGSVRRAAAPSTETLPSALAARPDQGDAAAHASRPVEPAAVHEAEPAMLPKSSQPWPRVVDAHQVAPAAVARSVDAADTTMTEPASADAPTPAAARRPAPLPGSLPGFPHFPGREDAGHPVPAHARTPATATPTPGPGQFHIAALSLPASPDVASTPTGTLGHDREPVPARSGNGHRASMMGRASHVESARPIDAAALAALQQPAAPMPRSVRIDRVQVTVQAAASASTRTPGVAAPAVAAPAPAPPPPFRNPWSGYFTRRD